MKKISSLFSIAVLLCVCINGFAEIRLPAAISSNMVLQQQSKSKLWGWASPNEKIFVTTSWNNVTDSTVTTKDAKWQIEIPTPAAGGPYTITLKGWTTVVLENVLIGEVWVCSGQSNMEWSSYNNLKQIQDILPTSSNPNIRLFNVPKTTSATVQDDAPGNWKVCSPESLQGFSAVGYFFGNKLQKDLNIPIGLINASWGGTPAEVWTPEEVIKNDGALAAAAAKINETPWWPNNAGYTYNAMIAPFTNFTIAGAIWYQGESNTGTASTYSKLLSSMIDGWRKSWKKDFPFYFVQIAPFAYGNKNIGALLQEQQTKTLQHPNTGMVVITDLVDDIKNIHPNDKLSVGNRLANVALAETYHKKDIAYKSPLFKNMEIAKGKATIFFDNAPNGLVTKENAKATEFYIAGADKNFVPADVKIEKDRIIVSSKQIKDPVAVRFGFSNTAMPNIFSKEGLPVTPFRTDDWDVDTSNVQ